MITEVSFAPGTVNANTNFDLPANVPDIQAIISATLFRGSDGTAAAAEVAVTATRQDNNTIQLDAAATTRDLLALRYLGYGEQTLEN